MKQTLKKLSCLLFFAQVSAYAKNPSDCKTFDVGCVSSQYNTGDSSTHAGTWAPHKGAVLYLGNGLFQAILYFDQDAVDYYKANPWAGLEVDIVTKSGLAKIDASTVKGPRGTKPLRDTIVSLLGEDVTRGITVIRPSQMKAGWNIFSFQLKSDIPKSMELEASIQLVANVSHEMFMLQLYAKNDNAWAYDRLYKWLVVHDVGFGFSFQSEVFKYFVMSRFDQVAVLTPEANEDYEIVTISPESKGEGLCWSNKRKEYEQDGAKKRYSFAKPCNLSNFTAIMNSASKPTDNSVVENVEDNVKQVSKEELVEVMESGNGDTGGTTLTDPQPTPTPPKEDSNISIKEFKLSLDGNHWENNIELVMAPGEEKSLVGRIKVKNKGPEIKDGDVDYRVENDKDFDDKDPKLDEDENVRIKRWQTITKTMKRIKFTVRDDHKVRVYKESGSKARDVDIINGQATFYIFADVEGGNDQDISSTHSGDDHYGKVVITVMPRSYSHEDHKQSPCGQAGYTTPEECAAMLIANEIL